MLADKLLQYIRDDLFVMTTNKENRDSQAFRKAVAGNLKRLATEIEFGRIPDPFPVFRKSKE